MSAPQIKYLKVLGILIYPALTGSKTPTNGSFTILYNSIPFFAGGWMLFREIGYS